MHFVKRDYNVGDRLSVSNEKCQKIGIYIGHAEIVYFDEIKKIVTKETIGEFILSGELKNVTEKYSSHKDNIQIIASAEKILHDKISFNNAIEFINYCI
ncbi:MAG: hypothetical protein SPL22_08600 [Treponema sp.]|uniref:hypothetical protein n=1 Tax=Treponema sp. TaxID=166 RepID=UPI002A91C1C8|nr:hypothetical protein [Treponema sp.]MDY6397778.1 hypothetical protein [Treponema sp.]